MNTQLFSVDTSEVAVVLSVTKSQSGGKLLVCLSFSVQRCSEAHRLPEDPSYDAVGGRAAILGFWKMD